MEGISHGGANVKHIQWECFGAYLSLTSDCLAVCKLTAVQPSRELHSKTLLEHYVSSHQASAKTQGNLQIKLA